jgi:alkanesulfonate monooxygenase SsuD/methylene tetrahydromethanopterin reductase-like flavin-dependent oxidoreductase (luciferase family)
VKFGLYVPHWTGASDGADPRWGDVLDTARAAEQAGFDSLWVIGHHYLPFGGGTAWSLWDPWSLLAALAAATESIELGPLVSCTAYRNPALLARTAAAVEEISGGRLILGIGGGYFDAEFGAFGIPTDHRVDRFEEAVAIIAGLLRNGEIEFSGQHYRAELALDLPQIRSGGPPILIGATQPRMMGLTARYADLWNVWLPFSSDPVGDFRERRRELDRACVAADRDPATIGRVASVAVGLLGAAVAFGPHEMASLGSDEGEIAERLQELQAAGVDHVQFCLAPATPQGVAALAEVVAKVA